MWFCRPIWACRIKIGSSRADPSVQWFCQDNHHRARWTKLRLNWHELKILNKVSPLKIFQVTKSLFQFLNSIKHGFDEWFAYQADPLLSSRQAVAKLGSMIHGMCLDVSPSFCLVLELWM